MSDLPPPLLKTFYPFQAQKTLTNVHSWFGAINQISYTFAKTTAMLPFRHLLSAKVNFMWLEELEKAFQASKQEIVRQCEKGVRCFTPYKPMALATDWSRQGMGFWLCQKFCECEGLPPRPGCCKDGWQTIFCSSRFCTAAESRYHPIEGDALAATYELEKCRFFVLGHPNLILCLDHKPLLSLFGDQDLASITNPRLFNFKTKSLTYRFQVTYIEGKKHVTPDALSRSPDDNKPPQAPANPDPPPSPPHDPPGGQVQSEYAETLSPPTWVASPATKICCIMSEMPTEQEMQESDQLEEDIMGSAMSSLTALNYSTVSPSPQSISALAQSGITMLSWGRLEAACQ